MLERVQLWWESVRRNSTRSDAELATATREVAKALAQTLVNRAFGRPELSAADPSESAREQYMYDRETVAKYHDHIHPEVESIRDEYVARGAWSVDLDTQSNDPSGADDLRHLIITLTDLADGLDDAE